RELPHTAFETKMQKAAKVQKPFSVPKSGYIPQNNERISELLCQIKTKLMDAKKQNIPVTNLDEELVLWIKTVSLGEYLTLEKTKSPVNDKIIKDFEDIL
ncbi:MAG: hypothetical protein J5597_07040, partial [Spirochaetaceae bacterium]|nr:hypothetical protein [Spirochaetaceae bacterium]